MSVASGTCCALRASADFAFARDEGFVPFVLADFFAVEWEEPLVEAERCEPDDVLLPDFAVEADSLTRLAEWWVVVC